MYNYYVLIKKVFKEMETFITLIWSLHTVYIYQIITLQLINLYYN
jgi:hypothetical protein